MRRYSLTAGMASLVGRPAQRLDFVLGTAVRQQAYGRGAAEALQEASAELAMVHRLMSFHSPASDIARLNQSAGAGPVRVSQETLELLDLAVHWSACTGGAFDATVAPLSALWKETSLGGAIPQPAAVHAARGLVGYRQLRLDAARGTAELLTPGAAVDLGGIGKGYAARRVRRVYAAHGVRSALASFGGQILAVGGRPDGSPWSVAIRHPRICGAFAEMVFIRDACVSTSGDDEQAVEHDGVRHHHIVDPRTGYPARSGLCSVSVVAPDPVAADVLSTAVFVAGAAAAPDLLRLADRAGALLVDERGEVSVVGHRGWAFAGFHAQLGAGQRGGTCETRRVIIASSGRDRNLSGRIVYPRPRER